MGIQELLDNPNEKSPAQSLAYQYFTTRLDDYKAKVKEQVGSYPPPV